MTKTTKYIKESPVVHRFAKEVLEQASRRDIVDSISDLMLVLAALNEQLEEIL